MSPRNNKHPMESRIATTSLLLTVCFCYAFTLYDATLYRDKPDLSQFGIKPIEVFYTQHVWPKGHSRDLPPPFEGVNHRLKKTSAKPGDFIVLDFEHWPLQGYRYKPWKYTISINNYTETIERFRACRPDLSYGFFGVIPVNNFKRAISDPASKSYRIWRGDVQRLIPLTAKIDAAFPVAYTYNDDPEAWGTYFSATMFEVKSIFDGEVYPFIWPQYFDHAPTPEHLRLNYMKVSLWRHQLETVFKKADGVVIWGGWDFKNKRAADWDDEAPWWNATKTFISEHEINHHDK